MGHNQTDEPSRSRPNQTIFGAIRSTATKTRLLVSVGGNTIRAIISFSTGLLIARGLGPSSYGDLTFLLGSFIAIRSLLDLGSANAFYTFLSQHTQGLRFYLSYFAWLALQFAITLSLVAFIVPSTMFESIWLGHDREIVAIAFLATFMQQQVWQTVGQIGESTRNTAKVQLLNLSIASAYLSITSLLLFLDYLSVKTVLFLVISQYAVGTVVAWRFLTSAQSRPHAKDIPLGELIRKYWVFCRPLVAVSLVGFLCDFLDKWLLQRFGGAVQQGYFQVAYQFSAISLLLTASVLNVFWKEIAEAWEKRDHARVLTLYRRINRGLVMLGAILTGLLLPWSEQIVTVFLGPAYVAAWPVLAIMFLYPIHQSMGQVGTVTLLATGNMRRYVVISITMSLATLPISYIILAPEKGVMIPGLELGAIGMALKMVLLGVIFVNVGAWSISRYCNWKYDWLFQVIGIPLMLGLGFASKLFVSVFWELKRTAVEELIVPVSIASLIYMLLVSCAVWLLPWLFGIEKQELRGLLGLITRKS